MLKRLDVRWVNASFIIHSLTSFIVVAHLLIVLSLCLPQTVLKREKSRIDNFFKDGISCCLPLDPAVHVKALDVEVRMSYTAHFTFRFSVMHMVL